jgi:hypothetical protein
MSTSSRSPAGAPRQTCSPVTRRGASPPTSPSCRNCCAGTPGEAEAEPRLSLLTGAAEFERGRPPLPLLLLLEPRGMGGWAEPREGFEVMPLRRLGEGQAARGHGRDLGRLWCKAIAIGGESPE